MGLGRGIDASVRPVGRSRESNEGMTGWIHGLIKTLTVVPDRRYVWQADLSHCESGHRLSSFGAPRNNKRALPKCCPLRIGFISDDSKFAPAGFARLIAVARNLVRRRHESLLVPDFHPLAILPLDGSPGVGGGAARPPLKTSITSAEIPFDALHSPPFVRPSFWGKIAQLVEQRTENPCVPGSIPGLATTLKTLLDNMLVSNFKLLPQTYFCVLSCN